MATNESNSLRPCPFCGGAVTVDLVSRPWQLDDYAISCPKCYQRFCFARTEAEAVKQFNSRPAEDALQAQLSSLTSAGETAAQAAQQRIEALTEERDELRAAIGIIAEASRRASQLWQKAHPHSNIWPDMAKAEVWLLEQNAQLRRELEAVRAALEGLMPFFRDDLDEIRETPLGKVVQRALDVLEIQNTKYTHELKKAQSVCRDIWRMFGIPGFEPKTEVGLLIDRARECGFGPKKIDGETCDCDRTVLHDCVCPWCKERYAAALQSQKEK